MCHVRQRICTIRACFWWSTIKLGAFLVANSSLPESWDIADMPGLGVTLQALSGQVQKDAAQLNAASVSTQQLLQAQVHELLDGCQVASAAAEAGHRADQALATTLAAAADDGHRQASCECRGAWNAVTGGAGCMEQ